MTTLWLAPNGDRRVRGRAAVPPPRRARHASPRRRSRRARSLSSPRRSTRDPTTTTTTSLGVVDRSSVVSSVPCWRTSSVTSGRGNARVSHEGVEPEGRTRRRFWGSGTRRTRRARRRRFTRRTRSRWRREANSSSRRARPQAALSDSLNLRAEYMARTPGRARGRADARIPAEFAAARWRQGLCVGTTRATRATAKRRRRDYRGRRISFVSERRGTAPLAAACAPPRTCTRERWIRSVEFAFALTPEAKGRILQGEANLQKRHEMRAPRAARAPGGSRTTRRSGARTAGRSWRSWWIAKGGPLDALSTRPSAD